MIMFSSQGVQLIFHTQGPISCTGRVGRLQEILQNTSFCVVNSAPLFKKVKKPHSISEAGDKEQQTVPDCIISHIVTVDYSV